MKSIVFTHRINDVITDLRFNDDYIELHLQNARMIKVSYDWAQSKMDWLYTAVKQRVTLCFDVYPNGELSNVA